MAAFMIRTKANANDVSRRFYVKGERTLPRTSTAAQRTCSSSPCVPQHSSITGPVASSSTPPTAVPIVMLTHNG